MGYVDRNLIAGETVIYRTKLHWSRYLWAGCWSILGILILISADSDGRGFGVFLLGIGIALGFLAFLDQISSEFVVTNRRLFLKQGIIRRRSVELLLSRMESLQVDQGIMGRILGYGSIVPGGSGGTKQSFKKIADPLAFRLKVNEQIEAGSSTAVVGGVSVGIIGG